MKRKYIVSTHLGGSEGGDERGEGGVNKRNEQKQTKQKGVNMYRVGPKESRLTRLYFEAKRNEARAVRVGDQIAAQEYREKAAGLLVAARDAEKGGE